MQNVQPKVLDQTPLPIIDLNNPSGPPIAQVVGMYEQLGIRVDISPSFNEVRSMRGISISLGDLPGLCRKIRQSIPAAIRRAMENRPEIA
ncbi:hypothetical protein [Pseudomonas sp. Fl4BN1]|uniref:hypothetical protein n=1 Tax=Pseudomonas sp. Fl4BN1 TaxID=2697651 RepID=UPI0013772D37|nr:hypothetical protein [Pseudomonas sp. Fl4BN1]NBF08996.1 hypothetical protein [Pseudomonas sp. Fl4BN1]